MATLRNVFRDIADAIRAKGVTGSFKPIEMAQKIGEIQTGGGGEDYGYLTFTAQQASTLKLGKSGTIEYPKLLKSTDAVNWQIWNNPNTNTISLSSGQSVYIKAADDASYRTATGSSAYNRFVMTGKIQVSGDSRSIVKFVAPADYSYWLAQLFYASASLTQAPELPVKTLVNNCYYQMFRGCTSLVQAPELPATTLANDCYNTIFRDCTSLTQAPELPAKTLASQCYGSMFWNCTSLTTAPELPAKTMTTNCYQYMFQNCTSLKRIKMNASSGNWGTYMFSGCTSLELVDMTGSTGVPTLSNVNNFQNTNATYKIVVPDSLYNTWIAATNWSSASIVSHIMKQSDWNAEHPDDILQ